MSVSLLDMLWGMDVAAMFKRLSHLRAEIIVAVLLQRGLLLILMCIQ